MIKNQAYADVFAIQSGIKSRFSFIECQPNGINELTPLEKLEYEVFSELEKILGPSQRSASTINPGAMICLSSPLSLTLDR